MTEKLFTAEFWAYEAFIATVFTLLMASGVYRARTRDSSKYVAIVFCLLAYLASAAIAVGHEWLRDGAVAYVALLKKPPPPAHLPADWGAHLPKENREKYSAALARMTFEQWGEAVKYFDGHGNLQPYVPSANDHQNRAKYVANIEVLEDQAKKLLFVAIAWLFLPLVGVAVGFTPIASRFFRAKPRANVVS